jgi:hypothetical protein
MKKILTSITLIFAFLTLTAPLAFAQVSIDPSLHPDYAPVVVLGSETTAADYGNYFLQLIAGGLLYLAAPIAVLIIAISGLRYVTSHGKPEAIEGAKKTLMWAIIGLLTVIFAYAIVNVIITTALTTNVQPTTSTSSEAPGLNPSSGGVDNTTTGPANENPAPAIPGAGEATPQSPAEQQKAIPSAAA